MLNKYLRIRVSDFEKKRFEKEAKEQTKKRKRKVTVSEIGREALTEYFDKREKE